MKLLGISCFLSSKVFCFKIGCLLSVTKTVLLGQFTNVTLMIEMLHATKIWVESKFRENVVNPVFLFPYTSR